MDLPSFNAFGIFLAIAAVGFLFLVLTLLFGEIFDFFDADHDFDHGDHGGPGFFSSRIMSVFITAFGGFGAIGSHYGLSVIESSAAGLAGGIVFGGLIYLFARLLHGQQASSDVRPSDLVGQSARVVIAIPAGGLGQIRCRIGEELVDKIARTADGQPMPENTSVLVAEVLGETVIVRKPE
jgi:membrane protein implicated in regulation of membrane protease activity